MEPEKRQNGLKIGCKVHKGCDVPSGFLHTAFCTFAYLIIGLSLLTNPYPEEGGVFRE
jgi:hypothetical protein